MLDVEEDLVGDFGSLGGLCGLGEVEERSCAHEEEGYEETLEVGHGEYLNRHSSRRSVPR